MKQACSNPVDHEPGATVIHQEITWLPPETIPGEALVSLRTMDGGRLLLLATGARIHRYHDAAKDSKDARGAKDSKDARAAKDAKDAAKDAATRGPAIALLYADAVEFMVSPRDEAEAKAVEDIGGCRIPLFDPAPCDACTGRTVVTALKESQHRVTIRCTRCGLENVMQDVFYRGAQEYWGCPC